MSVEEFAKTLKLIESDESVREQVAGGDLSAAGDLELTDEEKGLLKGAAEDYPEVAGFALNAYFKIDGLGQDKFDGLGNAGKYLTDKGWSGDKWDQFFPGAG